VRRLIGAVTLVTALALPLGAQIIPGFPGRPGMGQLQPVKRDTSKDTTNKVHWPTPDSITARLLARPGYTITRYQGDTAFFNAQTHALDLLAANKRRAIVDRDSQIVVSDSGIYYTETDRKVVTGGKYTLSPPPSSGQADIKGVGRVDYDLADRSARITRAKLPVNNGQMWYMDVALARVILDTGKELGKNHSKVEMIVNAEHKNMFVAHHTDGDAYMCIDACVNKLERQLSDHKKMVRNRKHPEETPKK